MARRKKPADRPALRPERFVGAEADIAFPDADGSFPQSMLDHYEGEGILNELEELADRNELQRPPLAPARHRPTK